MAIVVDARSLTDFFLQICARAAAPQHSSPQSSLFRSYSSDEAVQQTLVKAVAWPKHQLVWSKPHRLLIPVCCRVVYGENSHQLPDFPRSLYVQTLWHARPRAAGRYIATAAIFGMSTVALFGTFLRILAFSGIRRRVYF